MEDGEEKPTLTSAEKLAKFRSAETQARYHTQWSSKFGGQTGGGRGRVRSGGRRTWTRWGPPTSSYTPTAAAAGSSTVGASSEGNFVPGAAVPVPRVPIKCFRCNQVGHMRRECPLGQAQK